MRTTTCLFIAVAASAACVSDPVPPRTVSVYHGLGTLQCTAGGTSVDTLADRLRAAGVTVRTAACGTDGRMHPTVCGASDGRIGIFEIPASQRAQALAQGFTPLANLPDARREACR